MTVHWPTTRDELISRFCEPDHNGIIDIEDREQFTKFVDAALSRPDPSHTHHFRDDPEKQPLMTASALCNAMYDRGLMLNTHSGWIDRDGKFWGCAFAGHERLLELMGLNSIEQELEGWVKISRYVAHARFAPNEAQCATLMRIYDAVEGEHAFGLNLKHLADLPELPRQKGRAA